MNANTVTLIIVLSIALIVIAIFAKSPKYVPYRGSNYYGGGNVEEQLAFAAGYKPYMSNQY